MEKLEPSSLENFFENDVKYKSKKFKKSINIFCSQKWCVFSRSLTKNLPFLLTKIFSPKNGEIKAVIQVNLNL